MVKPALNFLNNDGSLKFNAKIDADGDLIVEDESNFFCFKKDEARELAYLIMTYYGGNK